MLKALVIATFGAALGFAQNAPVNQQVTPQVLAEMLRTAITFHQLVESLNLNRSLGPDVHQVGTDGQVHHSIERTAATIGAGAGVGAAIGGMTKAQNGALMGAIIGSAGGLIIDQIVKHKEETREKAAAAPVVVEAEPRTFKSR